MTINPGQQHNGKITTSDHVELYWQCWQPAKPLGIIVLVHGLAEHSNRYSETAEYFVQHGWAVFACDLRGHGLSSDGAKSGRVHINSFDEYARDVDAIIDLAKQQYPDLPCILLGHSMGGLISLTYLVANPGRMDGAVISSPLLRPHPDTELPGFWEFVVRILSKTSPRLLFPSNLDTSAVSRDPGVVKAYIDDPLISNKVSARWYVSTTAAMDDIHEKVQDLQTPTLLMHSGSDKLADPDASRLWAAKAPLELVDFVSWDGLYHEMFNEPEKEQVTAHVVHWLQHLFADRLPQTITTNDPGGEAT